MAADLYKMQDDQRFPEIRIDKPELSYSFRIAGISSPSSDSS